MRSCNFYRFDGVEQVFFCDSGFPGECITYEGPHSMECLQCLWEETRCVNSGYGSPGNLSVSEIAQLNMMNLR